MLVPEIKHSFFSWRLMGNSQPIQTLIPHKAPLLQLHTKNTHLRQPFILRRMSGIDMLSSRGVFPTQHASQYKLIWLVMIFS